MTSKKKPVTKDLSQKPVKSRESGSVKGGGIRLTNHNETIR